MSITPEPWLMLLVFVVFIITAFLLNTWLFKPLLGFMDEREASIQRDMNAVASSDEEVKIIQNEINQILAQARNRTSEIIENATNEAKSKYEEKIHAKQQEIARQLESFQNDLQVQKENLKTELSSHLPEFKEALSNKMKQI